MSTGSNILQLGYSGPVAKAFEWNTDDVSFIVGPVGSGKTTADMRKIVREASMQHFSPVDGKRRFAHCVFGPTQTTLTTNFLRSWFDYFPPTLGKYVGMPDLRHDFEINDGRGPIEFTLYVRSVDETSLERVTRGLEVTSASLFEADLIPLQALGEIYGRTGRYPKNTPHGQPARMRLWGELNMPDVDSDWYKILLGDERNAKYAVYRQPGGRDAGAENIANLPPGYYDNQMLIRDPLNARRMIDNIPITSRAGMPVFPEFNELLHAAAHVIEPLDRPLLLGADQGLHAAVIIGQNDDHGQLRVLDEIVADGIGEDVAEFGERVRAVLSARYRGLRIGKATADPAGWARSELDKSRSWSLVFSKITGIRFQPSHTNNPNLRQAALRSRMTSLVDGNRPGLLLSANVPILRRALASGYRRKKHNKTGTYYDAVEKNEYSHPAEALEYLCLGDGGLDDAIHRRTQDRHHTRPVVAPHEFAAV